MPCRSFNTWEPLENLVHCTVFREYVNQKFKSLEKDIYINVCNIKQKLKKKIRAALRQPKYLVMLEVQPFDPFEFKIIQVFYHLLPSDETYRNNLETLVFKNYFFKLDEVQRRLNDELLERIRKKEDIVVTMENELDFDSPPKFEYITKNFLTEEMYVIEQSRVNGCKCKTCSISSDCCPKLSSRLFPYRVLEKSGRHVIRLTKAEKIVECGDLCECGIDCINRVTQRPKEIPLCLFKTPNRGWGVKAVNNIPKGSFIIEYVGELIGQSEANSRSETAYLFDLNVDNRNDNLYYTIDAFKYGNLSRFINHSCDPNARIWFVNNCHGDPKNQKLVFFSDRTIAKGEEITIDYTGGNGRGEDLVEAIACSCGARACKKFIH